MKIIQITEQELESIFAKSIDKKFEEHKEKLSQNSEGEVILTRESTAALLGVNLSTLFNYTKKGKLKSYMIEGTGRVYYKKSEVLESLKLIA